jgi:SAM-dependent methyltransferase
MMMMSGNVRENLREAYDKMACERDAASVQDWKLVERWKFLEILVQEGKQTLLEIGAGIGKDGAFFQEHGLSVLCTDLSPENIRICKGKGLVAEVMDFTDLQFSEGSFDAVYALNCLLHLTKKEMPMVLRSINDIMKSDGLFYLGLYGGYDHEGVYPEDAYEPKRFFSFYDDDHLKRVVGEVFDIYAFKQIATGEKNPDMHFQSVVLRKRSSSL